METSTADFFRSLPEINTHSELEKEGKSKYVNANLQFDPYSDKAPFQNVLITFENIANLVKINKKQKFAIVHHPLDYPTNLHYHDYIEGIYVPSGRVLNIIDHSPFLMESNSFCLINKQTQHLIAKLPEDKEIPLIVNFLIHPDLLDPINQYFPESDSVADQLFSMTNFLLLNHNSTVMLEPLLHNMVHDYKKNKHNLSYKSYSYLILFLSKLIDSQNGSDIKLDTITSNCLKLIQEDPSSQSLESIAGKLNYSKEYISRHIKKQTGQTVSDLIMNEKLILAGKYLSQTTLTIEEIAKLVGYESESHFYRIFKKKFQVTPKQYRSFYS